MIDRLIMAVLFVVLCAWLGVHIILAAVETWRDYPRRSRLSSEEKLIAFQLESMGAKRNEDGSWTLSSGLRITLE